MALKVLTFGGSHPRHLYFLNQLRGHFDVVGSVVETRENIIPTASPQWSLVDRENFNRHFKDRDSSEEKYFGQPEIPKTNVLAIEGTQLNTVNTLNYVNNLAPDLIFIFGAGMIREPLINNFKVPAINMHLGLSPRYRGAATLFWPFYFLEPQYSGVTFHEIVHEPDAGKIVHQVCPPLERGDGIHDVGCRAVISASADVIKLISIYEKDRNWNLHTQKSTGKNFLRTDFRPEHLKVIYNMYENKMVDAFLDGQLGTNTPKLFRQFQ